MPPLPGYQADSTVGAGPPELRYQPVTPHVAQQRPVRSGEGPDLDFRRWRNLGQPLKIGLDDEPAHIAAQAVQRPLADFVLHGDPTSGPPGAEGVTGKGARVV